MFRNPLIQKAWEVRDQAAQVPLDVLLEAAVWLEEKFQQTPSKKLASALALQYLILAMRRAQTLPAVAKEYFARALRWQEEAERIPSAQQLLSGSPTSN